LLSTEKRWWTKLESIRLRSLNLRETSSVGARKSFGKSSKSTQKNSKAATDVSHTFTILCHTVNIKKDKGYEMETVKTTGGVRMKGPYGVVNVQKQDVVRLLADGWEIFKEVCDD
jgi:hypothetical protein